jgi:hypothetical protein
MGHDAIRGVACIGARSWGQVYWLTAMCSFFKDRFALGWSFDAFVTGFLG